MLVNRSRDTKLATNVEMATNTWSRFMGLMGRSRLPGDGCLVLEPGNSIHMFFMRFPIDALFVDKEWKVVHVCHGIKPWRVSRLVRKSKRVIELPAGLCASTGTAVGDQLGLQS